MTTDLADYHFAIARFPTAPGHHCSGCGLTLVCCALGPLADDPADDQPPRWCCPRCHVRLLWQVDTIGIWTAALRQACDPYWAWAAEDGRAAIAKAGVCVVSLTEPVARATAFKGRVWVGDTRCMVATRERADVIAAAWRRMGAPDTATAHRWTLALEAHLVGFFQDPRYVVASAVVQTGPRSLVMTADMSRQAWLATELVELVTTLHPDATWHLRGATDPVLAWLDGVPVAVVMPCREVVATATEQAA